VPAAAGDERLAGFLRASALLGLSVNAAVWGLGVGEVVVGRAAASAGEAAAMKPIIVVTVAAASSRRGNLVDTGNP
jgi:hypothetical protein